MDAHAGLGRKDLGAIAVSVLWTCGNCDEEIIQGGRLMGLFRLKQLVDQLFQDGFFDFEYYKIFTK